MRKKGFPKTVFVRREQDGNENFLLLEEKEFDIVSDEEPFTIYAEYQLLSVKKARKIVELQEAK